jgi:S1-C subfamily serine protease
LLGPDGKLAGIGSLIVGDAAAGLPGNMFVPIDRLQPVMGDLLALGRPSTAPHPWLGINLRELEGTLVVGRVASGGPSEAAGIQHGDRVTAIEGTPARDLADFYRTLWQLGDAGIAVKLSVIRQGREQEFEVRTIDRYRYLKLDTTY